MKFGKSDKKGSQDSEFAKIDQAMQVLLNEFNNGGMEPFVYNIDIEMRKKAMDQCNDDTALFLTGLAFSAAKSYILAHPDEDLGLVEKRAKYIILMTFGKVAVEMYEVKTRTGKVVYDTSKDFFPPQNPKDLYISGLYEEGVEAMGFPLHPNDVFDTVKRIFLPADKKKTIKDADEFIKIAKRYNIQLNFGVAPINYDNAPEEDPDENDGLIFGQFKMPSQEQVDQVQAIIESVSDPDERKAQLNKLFNKPSNTVEFKRKQ
ncbi:MAG: hypothetical protein LBT59_12150 [Clostridiales bacterium]|jgi:hypothetical protein|nr:hypothetical protein [Clostridiales bacterium]